MHCPSCGAKVNLTDNYNEVDILYCENCREKSSVRSQGKASKSEMQMQRRAYMAKYMREEIKTSKQVPREKIAEVYGRR